MRSVLSAMASVAVALAMQTPRLSGTSGVEQSGQVEQAAGVIAGVLVSQDTGQPVRKADLQLTRVAPRRVWSTISDADGRFAFGDLPAGEYALVASRPTYLRMSYGARRPGQSAAPPIRLSDGQKIEIVFSIPRGGVVAGRVTDEHGDPAFGTSLRAMRFGFENGFRTLVQAGGATTNDLGEYRIPGLLPGEYLIAAVPRDTVAAEARRSEALRARMAEIERSARDAAAARAAVATMEQARREGRMDPAVPPAAIGYVPVYYPGTTAPATAAAVTVGLSEQVSGIDLRLDVAETATVSGVVLGPDGQPWSGANVNLVDPSMPAPGVGVWFTTSRADGRFSYCDTPCETA